MVAAAAISASRSPTPGEIRQAARGSCSCPTGTGTKASRRWRRPRGCGSKGCPSSPCRSAARRGLPDVELLSLDAPTFGVAGKSVRIPLHDRQLAAARLRDDRHCSRRPTATKVTKEVQDRRHGAHQRLARSGSRKPSATTRVTLTVPRARRRDCSRTTTSSRRRSRSAKRNCGCWSSNRTRAGSTAICAMPCRAIRASSCRACCFIPGLSKVGGGNKDYIKQFPAGLDELSKFDVVFLGDVGLDDGQLTAEQCRLLKGLVEHQASGLVFMPGMQGRQFSLLETELDDLSRWCSIDSQPQRLGIADAQPFRADGDSAAAACSPSWPTRRTTTSKSGKNCPAFNGTPPVLTAKAGERSAVRSQGCLQRIRPAAAAGRRALSGPARCCSWGPTAPGAGARGSKTSTTIGSGGRSCAGWPISATWPRANRCGCTTAPDQPQMRQTIALHANVMDASGEPLHRRRSHGAHHGAFGQGRNCAASLRPATNGALFTAQFTPDEPGQTQGRHSFCKQTGATLETSFYVQGGRRRTDRPAGAAGSAGRDCAGDARQGDRGRASSMRSFGRWRPARSAARPSAACSCGATRSRPALIVVLMGIFWVGRKVIGLI